ncbi:stage III sporulation protein AA [Oceanobacillus sp. J11TS1]|uniref:stage III sporulation protein AA n=1 Tax=Oceanobacillus sp. J11TS1 TaxID=2807191 RepID=UPI001B0ED861|nr:stage III sporulation protein AA [Oceanobacillus sp. J11TS1]GIO23162.1 stage III sporulation protein AA [Oceanobacillus sp. J11TS1]
MNEILRLFPPYFQDRIEDLVSRRWSQLQEIRVRMHQKIEFIFDSSICWLDKPLPTKKEAIYILNQLSEYSLYRMEEELRNGYITIEGGHRVGIAGGIIMSDRRVKAIQPVSFFNIRIAKQKKGCADGLMPYIYDGSYHHTMILGAPQSGKTTVIRDICRQIAIQSDSNRSKKVTIVDERSEIAASIRGVPQHDVGERTDVLDACPKAEGMMMAIRTLSPDILVVDEIGAANDVEAIIEASQAGVKVICTIHASDMADLYRRPTLQKLLDESIFERFLLLGQGKKIGKLMHAFDSDGKQINLKRRGGGIEMDWRTAFN